MILYLSRSIIPGILEFGILELNPEIWYQNDPLAHSWNPGILNSDIWNPEIWDLSTHSIWKAYFGIKIILLLSRLNLASLS